jgi:hypothetical protein
MTGYSNIVFVFVKKNCFRKCIAIDDCAVINSPETEDKMVAEI